MSRRAISIITVIAAVSIGSMSANAQQDYLEDVERYCTLTAVTAPINGANWRQSTRNKILCAILQEQVKTKEAIEAANKRESIFMFHFEDDDFKNLESPIFGEECDGNHVKTSCRPVADKICASTEIGLARAVHFKVKGPKARTKIRSVLCSSK